MQKVRTAEELHNKSCLMQVMLPQTTLAHSGFSSGRVRQIWPAGKLERVFLAVRGIFEAQERPNLLQ